MQKTIKLYETPDMKVFEMHPESGMLNPASYDSAASQYEEENYLGEI